MTSNFASELKLMRLSNAFQISCAVHTAARLELGSHLDAQGKTVDELAKLTGVHSRGLGALLGFLVQLEVVAELEPGLYRSTDLTDRLYLVDNIAQGPEGLAAWAGLEGALRTGQTPFEAVHGMPFYDYAALRPEQSHRWNEWNSHASKALAPAIAAAIELAGDETLVDIGGGEGLVLGEILDLHPNCRGVLFELPSATGNVHPLLQNEPHRVVRGNALEEIPSLGEVYLLCRVLVNCTDDAAERLLAQCARAMKAGQRLIVFEPLQPELGDPLRNAQAASDLNLFVLWGGGQRTRAELQELFRRAGLPAARELPKTSMGITGFEIHLSSD